MRRPTIFVVDNYDSFTFNLVQYLGELGADLEVARNDAFTLDDVRDLAPDGIVVSPGPCGPAEAGRSMDVIRAFGEDTPLLGVCLGHQCIGEVYGGRVVRAPQVRHGKISAIEHDGTGVFAGLPQPFDATRYHSLVVDAASVPDSLRVTAWADGLVMGLVHRRFPVWGIQFHPESILTTVGHDLLRRFLGATTSAGVADVAPVAAAR